MIGTLLATLLSFNAPRMARRLRRSAIDYAIAGVALVLGLGFLLGAAVIWAAERWGGFEAALGFGIGFTALAVITMMVHRFIVAKTARRRAEEQRAEQMRAMAAAATIAAIPTVVRKAGIAGSIILPLAALAGYVLWQMKKPDDPDETD